MTAEAGNVPYRVALPEFEGPLDLLLHLCKTHEIEIVNIPIAFITAKYLEYLELMQNMPVDLAADYLVMAATLAYLKSRELVPSPEPLEATTDEDEEALDPREELIRRLLEYQKYKDAAEKLGGRPIEGRNVFVRGSEIEGSGELAPLAEHSAWKLIEAFGKILEKTGKKLTHDVVIDRVSISERINQLIDRIEAGGGSFRFDACFDLSLPEPELRGQLVVTLLAVLELARLKVVRVLQSPDGETLFISQVSGAKLADARSLEVTSAQEAQGQGDGESEAEAGAEGDGQSEGVAEAKAEGDGQSEAVAEGKAEGEGESEAVAEAKGEGEGERERETNATANAIATATDTDAGGPETRGDHEQT